MGLSFLALAYLIDFIFETNIISETFLLDSYSLPADLCLSIADGILKRTCWVVSDGSIDLKHNSSGTAAISVHTSEDDADPLICAKWTTGTTRSKANQESYSSKLGGVIDILTVVDIIVQFYTITTLTVEKCTVISDFEW